MKSLGLSRIECAPYFTKDTLEVFVRLDFGPYPGLFHETMPLSFLEGGPIIDRSTFLFLNARQSAYVIIPDKEGKSLLKEEIKKKQRLYSYLNKSYKKIRVQFYYPSFFSEMPDKSSLRHILPYPKGDEMSLRSGQAVLCYEKEADIIYCNLETVLSSHLQNFLYKHDKEIKKVFKGVVLEVVKQTHPDKILERRLIYSTKIPLEQMQDFPFFDRSGKK